MDTILITGGAGFIGAHLAETLLAAGYNVRVLDSLEPQVHGPERRRPAYLNPAVELQRGDVRDPAAVQRALRGVNGVFHLAARVGVGQSMYQVQAYTDTNINGTAVLLEQLMVQPVERLVVASSMSIYGEGLYRNAEGQPVQAERRLPGPAERAGPDAGRRPGWDITDAAGVALEPVPTPETRAPALSSVYALGKLAQEQLCLMCGKAYGQPTVALRFFNVYGKYQALSNPYTGVLAIFGNRLLHGRPPLIFEDGLQRRDFVHVRDVARACQLALEESAAVGGVFNIGSGRSLSILDLSRKIARVMGTDIAAEITGEYRTGDIRHCFADISRARQVLGFRPTVPLDQGLQELADWLARESSIDRVEQARDELRQRRLAL